MRWHCTIQFDWLLLEGAAAAASGAHSQSSANKASASCRRRRSSAPCDAQIRTHQFAHKKSRDSCSQAAKKEERGHRGKRSADPSTGLPVAWRDHGAFSFGRSRSYVLEPHFPICPILLHFSNLYNKLSFSFRISSKFIWISFKSPSNSFRFPSYFPLTFF